MSRSLFVLQPIGLEEDTHFDTNAVWMNIEPDIALAQCLVAIIIPTIIGGNALGATADAIQEIIRVIDAKENAGRLQKGVVSTNTGTQ